MRNKSIRKNKTNRKKTNLKKTYRKEKYHKKTNRKRTNHKKTKHRKTYLKKRNIQRGGEIMNDDEFKEFYDKIIEKDFSNYYRDFDFHIEMLMRKVFSDENKADEEKLAAFEKMIQNLIDILNDENYRTIIIFILQLVKNIVGELNEEILIESLKKFFDSKNFQALDISEKKGTELYRDITGYDYQETDEVRKKHLESYMSDIVKGATYGFVNDDDDDDGDGDGGDLDFTDPEMAEALIEEIEQKEAQLRLAAEFGQTLLEKNGELQEENEELQEEKEAMEREKEAALVKAEEAEFRAEEAQEYLKKLIKARNEELDTAVSEAEEKGKKEGYEEEKSNNEKRLKEILESVNKLGSVTEGKSYSPVTDTEDIESTLKNMAGVIEGKIKQQIKLGTAEATQSLMKAQTEQATLDERIVELEKEVEEARATREKAKQEKDSALKSLKAEEIKNLKLINSHKAEVEGHVNAQKVYRENNTKLKEQNEKLTIELAEKEDCIAKTKIALVENSDDV